VKVARGNEAGVCFRVTAPALGRDAQRGYFVGLNATEQRVRLVRFDGGADGATVQLIAVSHELRDGAWHAVSVLARGEEFTVEVDGKIVLRAKDSRWRDGTVGLRVAEGSAEFSSFAVEPAVVGSEVRDAARRVPEVVR
jgi:hypothetical protein